MAPTREPPGRSGCRPSGPRSWPRSSTTARARAARSVRRVRLGNARRLWEHTFVTAQTHAHARFRRAIERRALWMAEDAARELPNLPLEEALELVHLYAERGSPKYEKAAMRWLR